MTQESPSLHRSIEMDRRDQCKTTEIAVASKTAARIFDLLVGGVHKDPEATNMSLFGFGSKNASQMSQEELLYFLDFFAGGKVYRKYQAIMRRLAPNPNVRYDIIYGRADPGDSLSNIEIKDQIIDGVGSLESLKEHFKNKIIEMGVQLWTMHKDNNATKWGIVKLLESVGFSIPSSGQTITYSGVEITNLAEPLTTLEIEGVSDIAYLRVRQRDDNGAVLWGVYRSLQDSADIPFYRVEGENGKERYIVDNKDFFESVHTQGFSLLDCEFDTNGRIIAGTLVDSERSLSLPFWREGEEFKYFLPDHIDRDIAGITFYSDTLSGTINRVSGTCWFYRKSSDSNAWSPISYEEMKQKGIRELTPILDKDQFIGLYLCLMEDGEERIGVNYSDGFEIYRNNMLNGLRNTHVGTAQRLLRDTR